MVQFKSHPFNLKHRYYRLRLRSLYISMIEVRHYLIITHLLLRTFMHPIPAMWKRSPTLLISKMNAHKRDYINSHHMPDVGGAIRIRKLAGH